MQDKKTESGWLLWMTLAIVLALVVFSYFRYIVKQDFNIYAQVTCDPETEECFKYECDPTEDITCSLLPEEQVWYYKLIYASANSAPLCDIYSDEGCPELTCEEEGDCEVIECSAELSTFYHDYEDCF